jgi:hypothetical protein
MPRFTRSFHLSMVILLLFLAVSGAIRVQAASGPTEQPLVREASITLEVVRYEWWLLRWSNNSFVCQVIIDHEGLPTPNDIDEDCGDQVYKEWASTPACTGLMDGTMSPADCSGMYLYFLSAQPTQKTIIVELPPPEVDISLSGCIPTIPDNLCGQIPSLLFTGQEPLPNESIVAIHAVLNGVRTDCSGAVCEVPLGPTTMQGMPVEFWADSSYGDSSVHFTAHVRVIDSGVSALGSGWYVDVLSSQWVGRPTASCAQVWQAFPPVGGPPSWLYTPEAPELLATDIPYNYLAGRLIAQGVVDASACPGGGLLSNGYSDACGLEAAMPYVQEWQNLFDSQIIQVADETGVPAQLMKNLFAQESQFWPGAFKDPHEYGLGQLTDNGAEAILLWNSDFYNQFCPLVLDEAACQRGYVYLDEESQTILRGALAMQVKADCTDCPAGIDLSNVNFSINLFAQTLLANCEQVAQVVYNATGQIPGEVSSYEDLWRFTVANYHVGPGCLSYAMYTAWSARAVMDWDHIQNYLTDACKGVIPYVDNVTVVP